MAYELIELRRNNEVTGQGIVIEDYETHPTLCRKGVWVGLKTYFAETVVVSFEHHPDELSVVWSLQHGARWLGAGSPDAPSGPVPGATGVSYRTPIDGFWHRVAFVSQPDTPATSIAIQAYYSKDQSDLIAGPNLNVDISGGTIQWPTHKLDEEEACRRHWHDLLTRYVRWEEPQPLDPITTWLDAIHGPAAVRVAAIIEELETLDPEADPELAEALRADLTGQARWALAQQHATRSHH